MAGTSNKEAPTPSLEPPASEPAQFTHSQFISVLVGLMVVGLALRVAFIASNGLWHDEITTLRRATESWSDFARWYQEPDPHPPLYYLGLRAARALTFGWFGETGLRLVGLSSFILQLGVLGWYGSRRAGDRVAAVVVAALVAVSPSHTYLSSELRMYGLVTALALILLILGIRWLEKPKGSCRLGVALALVSAAMGLTHYTGLLVAGCLLASVLVVRAVVWGRVDLSLIGAGLLALVMFAPILPVFVEQLEFIQATLYPTDLDEALGFLVWGFGPVGAVACFGAATALFLPAWDRGDTRSPSSRAAIAVPLLATGFFCVAVVIGSVLRDLDLFNFGISTIAPMFVVFGVSSFAQQRLPRFLLLATALAVIVSIPITLGLNSDPASYEPNRVSTFDTLDDSLVVLQQEGLDTGSLTVIHIDWAPTNDYFLDAAANRYPSLELLMIAIPDYLTLESVLTQGFADGSLEAVLVISRLPLEKRILPQTPAGSELVIVDPNAVLVSP